MSTKLEGLGFAGSVKFILNEEGSGAKYYKNSVYYPDSRTSPKTNSGITIDPGVDLANCDDHVLTEVFDYYAEQKLLSDPLLSLLLTAVGKVKHGAIEWINNNERYFKNKFLVPDVIAENVFANYSGDDYWSQLVIKVNALLDIKQRHIEAAVHTALLSLAYNYGAERTARLVKYHIDNGNYVALAVDIKTIKHNSKALTERRQREGNLILSALEKQHAFEINFDDINPLPVTALPIEEQDTLRSKYV